MSGPVFSIFLQKVGHRGAKQTTEHLFKLLTGILELEPEKEGFRVETVDDNIYRWKIWLFNFAPEVPLSKDLEKYKEKTGKEGVCLEILFPKDYPSTPPFIRVVYPRFRQYTGHITIGGSICVYDLTRSGWNPENDLIQIFVMIRQLLVDGGAAIDFNHHKSKYTEKEAKEAFTRVALQHGWEP